MDSDGAPRMLAIAETATEVVHLKLVAAAAKPKVEHLGRVFVVEYSEPERPDERLGDCLLYTSDAADE